MTDLPSSYSANRMRLLSSSSIEWFFSFISTISTSWSSLFLQSISSFTVYQLYGNQTATTTWHSTNSFSTSFQSNLSVDNQYDPVVGWAECSERQSISIQPRARLEHQLIWRAFISWPFLWFWFTEWIGKENTHRRNCSETATHSRQSIDNKHWPDWIHLSNVTDSTEHSLVFITQFDFKFIVK